MAAHRSTCGYGCVAVEQYRLCARERGNTLVEDEVLRYAQNDKVG